MALNPMIALSGQNPDYSAPFRRKRERERQNQLMDLRERELELAERTQNRADKAAQRELREDELQSMAIGAAQAKQFLDEGNMQGLRQFIANRTRNIVERGGDPRDTVEIGQLLNAGETDRVRDMLDSTIRAGQMTGVFGQSGDRPAQTRHMEFMLQGLGPEEAERARRIALGLESRAGQGRVEMIGNVPHWVTYSASGEPQAVPLSDLSREAEGEATVAGARVAAEEAAETEAIPERARVESTVEDYQSAPARLQAENDLINHVEQNLEPVFDRVLENASVWTTGFGSMVKPPGSPAANLASDLNTIAASTAFERLQQMRDQSQTGGALGQVSERELALLRDSVRSLEQSQGPEQFRENVQALRDHYQRVADIARDAREMDRLKARIASLRQRPQSQELNNRIQGLQQQLFSLEDKMWNRLDEGGSEQQSGPVRISSDEEYDQLSSGTRFVGPDGVERVKP